MKLEPTDQKLRGGYYTPEPIARFLADWVIRSSNDKVLEPSCGDGNLLVASATTLLHLGAPLETLEDLLFGIEFDQTEAEKAINRLRDIGVSDPQINIDDFFNRWKTDLSGEYLLTHQSQTGKRFDAIIGNPPFIRYQNFPEDPRHIAFEIMQRAGMRPSRLTNMWLPFLVASSFLLKETGRLAMVIPAELFQVNYAAQVRLFLSDFFGRITIVSFEQLVFDGIQQEVVLLLAERGKVEHEGIRVIELKDTQALSSFEYQNQTNSKLKPMDHTTEKWTQYFLSIDEIELLRKLRHHPDVTLSGNVIDVDVGIVTGYNKFFILNKNQVETYQLEPHLERIVVRSGHLRGAIFSGLDWTENVEAQLPALFFMPPDEPMDSLPISLQEYILEGESAGIHRGYKCRIRKKWYIVPSVWIPDAFMLRQVHAYPKLIVNNANVTCTDTIHRVRFLNGANKEATTSAFLNSLTFAFAEVTGRSYGGGVLTFEPSEAESLPIPLVGAEKIDIKYVDERLRVDDINSILDMNDKILLDKGLGLNKSEIQSLRDIWVKLRDRRINRKHKRKKA